MRYVATIDQAPRADPRPDERVAPQPALQRVHPALPKPGWVEHAEEIWRVSGGPRGAAQGEDRRHAPRRDRHHEPARDDRRWDRATGEPIHRAIVWRTAAPRPAAKLAVVSRSCSARGPVRSRSVLLATKIEWILDTARRAPRARRAPVQDDDRGSCGSSRRQVHDRPQQRRRGRSSTTSTAVAGTPTCARPRRRRLLPEVRDSAGVFCRPQPGFSGARKFRSRGSPGISSGALRSALRPSGDGQEYVRDRCCARAGRDRRSRKNGLVTTLGCARAASRSMRSRARSSSRRRCVAARRAGRSAERPGGASRSPVPTTRESISSASSASARPGSATRGFWSA